MGWWWLVGLIFWWVTAGIKWQRGKRFFLEGGGGRGLGVELFSSLRNSSFKNHVGRTILMQNFSITHLIKAKTIAKLCPT